MKTLAIKYRPTTFDDVVEQGPIKAILQDQINSKTHKNSYLFTGGAGTGKTTCARIFANELNEGSGTPIELDAASHNSVDDVREIIQEAGFKSLDSKYRVYIIDECFHAETPILLGNGKHIPIKDVEIGDSVRNMIGVGTVKNVFRNLIPLERLCIINLTDASHMLTTKDHLFFTNNGWVEASKLTNEDVIFNGADMYSMWEKIRTQNIPEDLFERVYGEANFKVGAFDDGIRKGENLKTELFEKDEGPESDAQYRNNSENGEDQIPKRDIESSYKESGRKREVYNTADDPISSTGGKLEVRICNSYKNPEGKWIPNMLQSRPRITRENVSSRGGWQSPRLENWIIERYEEVEPSNKVRVESITFYERGNNGRSFKNFFTDKELGEGFVELYDLEVSEHSSYFANNILVHNCHSLSNSAWQAMLKLIEEPPANTIFIFCTTDPQKIPATILSRVQRFDFRRISYNSIINRLTYIIKWENEDILETVGPDGAITSEPEALSYIAKIADGGMRDAITLLDKCLSFSYDLTVKNVVEALGTVNYQVMLDLLNSIYDKDSAKSIEIVENVYRSGSDLKQFIKQMQYFVLDAYKYYLYGSLEYTQLPNTLQEDLDEINFEKFAEFELYLLRKLITLNSSIKWESNPKPYIESAILLICLEENYDSRSEEDPE